MHTRETRIADLEAELAQRDAKIKELIQERDEALELVREMREHIEAQDQLIEEWKYACDMELRDDGKLQWDADASAADYDALEKKHNALVRDWNKYLYRAKIKPPGRPLAASDEQQDKVKALRKKKLPLRQIARETGLSLQTVRTVLDKGTRRDRTKTEHANLRRKHQFDKTRAAAYRARKRARDGLPKRITEVQAAGEALVKAAKGLGR
jgi:hypothetical protein